MELPLAPGELEPPTDEEPVEAAPRRRWLPVSILALVFFASGAGYGYLFKSDPVPPKPLPTVTVTAVPPAPIRYGITKITGRSVIQVLSTEVLRGCLPVVASGGTYVSRGDATTAARDRAAYYVAASSHDTEVLLAEAVRIPEGSAIYHIASAEAKYIALVIVENCL